MWTYISYLRKKLSGLGSDVTVRAHRNSCYSPEEGRVRVVLAGKGRFAELTVSNDTAVPVPEEAVPRLFDRFYRADPSRSSETGGFGIGLSVVRSVAEAHGAKVKAGTDGKDRFFLTVSFPV